MVWILRLLSDLGITTLMVVDVFRDSQSTIHIAKNLAFHERTKHIEVGRHFVQDALKSGVINLLSISTSSQLANVFINLF